jgi:hypothetical protein
MWFLLSLYKFYSLAAPVKGFIMVKVGWHLLSVFHYMQIVENVLYSENNNSKLEF